MPEASSLTVSVLYHALVTRTVTNSEKRSVTAMAFSTKFSFCFWLFCTKRPQPVNCLSGVRSALRIDTVFLKSSFLPPQVSAIRSESAKEHCSLTVPIC